MGYLLKIGDKEKKRGGIEGISWEEEFFQFALVLFLYLLMILDLVVLG